MNTNKRLIKLFLVTFSSSLLLIFGVGTLVAMFVPPLIALSQPVEKTLALPLSPERTERFLEINEIPFKSLFPQQQIAGAVDHEPEDGTVGWIRIPSIGVNVPLAMPDSLSDDDVIKTLDLGAAFYPNGVEPGNLGNVFVAAHSTGEPWRGKYRFAFLRINEVDAGEEIFIDYNGTRYTYKVTDTEVIVPTPDYRVISDRPVPTMTLMACWPLWSSDKRMLKHAELTNITKLTQRPF